ncbi:MAG: hypothetical protein JNK48_34905 [Bryobacterales bacterium]|nr:hypothetical protein [Bryobacterales bacterium]
MHPPVSSDAPTLAATPPAPPPQSAPPQPTYVVPQPKQGLPAWAVVLLVAVLLIGAGWAGITYLRPSAGSSAAAPTTETKMATPGETPKAAHPFAKHLEITGLRILETPKQKLQIQMIVVNHSAADLPDLNLEVRLRSSKADPSAEPVTSFTVRVPSVAGYESKEVKAEASTKLRAYEFPDWQFLRAEFDVKEQ